MNGKADPYESIVILLLVFFYTVGVILFWARWWPGFNELVSPYFLLTTGTLTVWLALRTGTEKLGLWVLIVFLGGIVAEWVGVHTGWLFGDYQYGDILGMSLGGVPVIIGLNWVIVMLGVKSAISEISRISQKQFLLWYRFGLGALFIFVFDFVLEKVAIAEGWWEWSGDNVPIYNYGTWIGLGLIFLWLSEKLGARWESLVPLWNFALIWGFLLLVFITH